MRVLVGFLGGVAAGAIAALLLAPKSGAELRGHLADRASAQWQTASSQLDKSTNNAHAELATQRTSAPAPAQKED
jgi:gas vesicle protein